MTLTATWRDEKLVLIDTPTDLRYLRQQRTLTLDSKGRLILEKPLNPRADDEPAVQSQRVLDARRVVFESDRPERPLTLATISGWQ